MCANAKQLKIQSLLCLGLYSYNFRDSKLCAHHPISLLPCHPTVQTPVSCVMAGSLQALTRGLGTTGTALFHFH